ncbi:hypothetical protein FIBSPDRAFT_952902 [Athelia psychrophila]|uniref:Uncharacterized protein n=1 Tax=Athelia psychrophila TaxID=1759441 RepID=A0A166KV68_9AGAM|nr:hypothetical protein FIBSPDRAFT_952902 [Fibularhizoctonia sp. CBS 109695]
MLTSQPRPDGHPAEVAVTRASCLDVLNRDDTPPSIARIRTHICRGATGHCSAQDQRGLPCAASKERDGARSYEAVQEVAMDLYPALGLKEGRYVRGDEVEGKQEQSEVQPSKTSRRYERHGSEQLLDISPISSRSRLGGLALAQNF